MELEPLPFLLPCGLCTALLHPESAPASQLWCRPSGHGSQGREGLCWSSRLLWVALAKVSDPVLPCPQPSSERPVGLEVPLRARCPQRAWTGPATHGHGCSSHRTALQALWFRSTWLQRCGRQLLLVIWSLPSRLAFVGSVSELVKKGGHGRGP